MTTDGQDIFSNFGIFWVDNILLPLTCKIFFKHQRRDDLPSQLFLAPNWAEMGMGWGMGRDSL